MFTMLIKYMFITEVKDTKQNVQMHNSKKTNTTLWLEKKTNNSTQNATQKTTIEQHKPHKNKGIISGAPERDNISCSTCKPVVLITYKTTIS